MSVVYSISDEPSASEEVFDHEVLTQIHCSDDVLTARQMGRLQALSLGFGRPEASLLAAAISEVARNIVEHADTGEIVVRSLTSRGRKGLRVIARDRGPGIPDVAVVTQYGLSERAGHGVGLPGAKLLVDEFHIVSSAHSGTTVTMTKWMAS